MAHSAAELRAKGVERITANINLNRNFSFRNKTMIPLLNNSFSVFRRLSTVAVAVTAVCLAGQSLEAQNFGSNPNGPATFRSLGNGELEMIGTLDGSTRLTLARALSNNPGTHTIVMQTVPGSNDDDGALSAYNFVRERRLNTRVPSNGVIASGGVDFFCAGVRRTVDPGGKLLVHPWEEETRFGGTIRGDQVPQSDSRHDFYINYYRRMGIGAGFYSHTLNAPRQAVLIAHGWEFTDMHEMTPSELRKFGVVTGSSSQPPVGTVSFDDLIGRWTAGKGQLTIQPDHSFSYVDSNFQTQGTVSLRGMTVTLSDGFGDSQRNVVSVEEDMIQFSRGQWTRLVGRGVRPRSLKLNGDWNEINASGVVVKRIMLEDGDFLETSENGGEWEGSYQLKGDRLTLTGDDGDSETLVVRADGKDRINFLDPNTRQIIRRFHWKRQPSRFGF